MKKRVINWFPKVTTYTLSFHSLKDINSQIDRHIVTGTVRQINRDIKIERPRKRGKSRV
jgi:hypothetical protein